MSSRDRSRGLADELGRAFAGSQNGDHGPADEDHKRQAISWLTDDPHVGDALRIELDQARIDGDGAPVPEPSSHDKKVWTTYWDDRLAHHPHNSNVLKALLGYEEETEKKEGSAGGRGGTWTRSLRRRAAVVWMNVLILAPLAVTFFTVWGSKQPKPNEADISVALLKIFTVWVLSFVPSWLYVRFLGQRAGALWNEFVVHLHRLRVDHPRYLPPPPRSSQYYVEWWNEQGYLESADRNLYRQKFNAYYGSAVSKAELGTDFVVTAETMFPVFLSTVVLATSWVAVLYNTDFATNPTTVWDFLKFGFLGAYAFTVQSLVRRFFQSDLRPSAYAAVILRLVVVFTTLIALYQLVKGIDSPGTQAVVAFVVGGFPLVGIYALHRTAAAALRSAVPQLTPPYPLNQIDGLNVWYEARLLEEGIEDMENLATANLVDVMLHTRVPVHRLIDWLDQAFLYLHLDRMEVTQRERRQAYADSDSEPSKWRPFARRRWRRQQVAPREEFPAGAEGTPKTASKTASTETVPAELGASLGPNSRAGTITRTRLRRIGIRTATDLLKAFPPDQIDPRAGASADRFDKLFPGGLDLDQIRTLVRVLDEETGLVPVWNWQARGMQAVDRHRRPRSLAHERSG